LPWIAIPRQGSFRHRDPSERQKNGPGAKAGTGMRSQLHVKSPERRERRGGEREREREREREGERERERERGRERERERGRDGEREREREPMST